MGYMGEGRRESLALSLTVYCSSITWSWSPRTKVLLPLSSFESHRTRRKETCREEEGDLPREDKDHNNS